MVVRTGQGTLADEGEFFNAVQHSGERGVRVTWMGADEGASFVALVRRPERDCRASGAAAPPQENLQIRLEPVEAVFGFAARVVFAAYIAFVAGLIEEFEDIAVIHFSFVGFVP